MYKILSIDGGGIKGIAPASFLATIEETTKKNVIDYFDLIVGTSTGGIIALGLGLEFTAREILSLYMDNGHRIFEKKNFISRKFSGLFSPKNNSGPLQELLKDKFKDRLLGQSKTRLVIPAFDIVNNGVCIFKTSHHERLKLDYTMSAVDIALSTSAAPYYFSPHKTSTNKYLVDGGLFANNPTLLGVIEGLSILNWPKEEIRVLSLSCTDEVPIYSKFAGTKPGIFNWGKNLVDLLFNSQAAYATGASTLLLDDRDNKKIIRITSTLSHGDVALDDISKSKKLYGIGHENARQNLEKIESIFLSEKVSPFVPCHSL